MKKSPYVGRVVAVATAVCSLILAVLPVIANLDWRSTAGVLAGIAAIVAVAQRWLTGLQAHEARLGDPATAQAQLAADRRALRKEREQALSAVDLGKTGTTTSTGATANVTYSAAGLAHATTPATEPDAIDLGPDT